MVIEMLQSMGPSASVDFIERIHEHISSEPIKKARRLLSSSKPWVLVFDNINIYLRKFTQRIGNHHMAVIECPEDIPSSTFDLAEFKRLRGCRLHQRRSDLDLTPDGQARMQSAFKGMVAKIIFDYCRGSCKGAAERNSNNSSSSGPPYRSN